MQTDDKTRFLQSHPKFKNDAAFMAALRHDAPTNPYARATLQRERQAEIATSDPQDAVSVEQWGALGDSVDTLASVADLGAHHNLMRLPAAIREGNYKAAAGEVVGATARVVGSALLNKGAEKLVGGLYRGAKSLRAATTGTEALTVGKTATRVTKTVPTRPTGVPVSRVTTGTSSGIRTEIAPRTARLLSQTGETSVIGRGQLLGESVGTGTRTAEQTVAQELKTTSTYRPPGPKPPKEPPTRIHKGPSEGPGPRTPKPPETPVHGDPPGGPPPVKGPKPAPTPDRFRPQGDAGAVEWLQQMKQLQQAAFRR